MADQAIVAARVKRITLHEIRHTNATLDLEAGVYPKIVSDRLGHKKIETTLNLKSHVSIDLQKAAADALAARLFGPDEANSPAHERQHRPARRENRHKLTRKTHETPGVPGVSA